MNSISTTQLHVLIDIARQAGAEIMQVYAQDCAVWQKSDASPLTEADIRADRVIRQRLKHHFPNVFILSEESGEFQNGEMPLCDTFFLVDPLDGTKEFLKRNGEFTVNIALIHQGKVLAGVVFAPALDELFYSSKGFGAWSIIDGRVRELRVSPMRFEQSLRVIGSRSHDTEKVDVWLQTLGRRSEFKSVGSSLKFCRIAQGEADIYPRFGSTSQWDTAAGQGILEMAGGMVVDCGGESLSYGLHRTLINPEFFAQSCSII